MEKVNILVIGAGAVGLAIAQRLAQNYTDVVVAEKERSFGRHTSSRNSEVIHAGHYYEPGSLKASLCVEGNKLLYEYLRERGIPHQNTGKIIVATTPDEQKTLEKYLALGLANSCGEMRLLTRNEVNALEPQVKCHSGLFVGSTGIFDTHKYMHSLAEETEELGGFVVYDKEVTGIKREAGLYIVEFSDGEVFQCATLINSAGLWATPVAQMAMEHTLPEKQYQYWCKGEYYKSTRLKDIQHLVYPVADPKGVFLGIHLTINLNGEVRFGPNAFYVDEIDYKFHEEYFNEFYASISRYLDISADDLVPDDTGIRPKLQGPNDGFRDFYIREESPNGYPGLINLIGIESPGLTASLAIADYVDALLTSQSKR